MKIFGYTLIKTERLNLMDGIILENANLKEEVRQKEVVYKAMLGQLHMFKEQKEAVEKACAILKKQLAESQEKIFKHGKTISHLESEIKRMIDGR